MITFAYRKSQLVNVAAEKTTEEHLNEAVRRTGKDLNCEFNDYALYIDDTGMVSRYVLLLEPDQPIDIDRDGHYADLMEKHLCEVNPEYEFFSIKRGSIGKPLVLIQQPQTHALWREMKIAKGSSPNQVKPVRVLDVPMKQKFFFGLLEEGQDVPEWNVYKQKQ
jgi:hypothetical protein